MTKFGAALAAAALMLAALPASADCSRKALDQTATTGPVILPPQSNS
ncbi:MAG: hypothetical protein Q4G25_03800 [Paracoccus sp. (in: a-proteobacteria)]|nr:hypothetical protein [Paracoccus sp. (in: a-proteobacteria)]